MGQEVNALAVMVDTFVRLVGIEVVKALVWAPIYIAVTVLHVWLSKHTTKQG